MKTMHSTMAQLEQLLPLLRRVGEIITAKIYERVGSVVVTETYDGTNYVCNVQHGSVIELRWWLNIGISKVFIELSRRFDDDNSYSVVIAATSKELTHWRYEPDHIKSVDKAYEAEVRTFHHKIHTRLSTHPIMSNVHAGADAELSAVQARVLIGEFVAILCNPTP